MPATAMPPTTAMPATAAVSRAATRVATAAATVATAMLGKGGRRREAEPECNHRDRQNCLQS
jgi:hypothetical protein